MELIKIFGLVAEENDAKCIETIYIEILMLLKFRLWVSIY